MGPLNQRINQLSAERQAYLQAAKEDVEMRRASHNSQVKVMQKEENRVKRQVRLASLKENFMNLGQRVGGMGPRG